MKKTKILVLFSLLLATLFVVSASAVTNVSECETTIDTPGEYHLNQSITGEGLPFCITIDSDDVLLDCKGHTMIGVEIMGGSRGIGISISNQKNITVKNCIISSFSTGIQVEKGNNIFINNVTSTNNSLSGLGVGNRGIYFLETENSTIQNSNISETAIAPGIYLKETANITIFNNNIIENNIGINEEESTNIIINSNIISFFDQGISLADTTNSIIQNNLITYLGGGFFEEGISILQSWFTRPNNNTFINNTIEDTPKGLMVYAGNDMRFTDNIIKNSTETALLIWSGSDAEKNEFENLKIQSENNLFQTKLSITEYELTDNLEIKSTENPIYSNLKNYTFFNMTGTGWVKMGISYSEETGVIPPLLGFYRHNSTNWTKDGILNQVIDTTNKMVLGNVTEFSQFALLQGEPDDYIDSCGTTIGSSGVYMINDTLTSAGGNCINITAENVTLSGDGFTITGNGTSGCGIQIIGLTNITISDFLSITNFTSGICAYDSDTLTIEKNTIHNNTDYGVIFDNVNESFIDDNIINYNNNTGIDLQNSNEIIMFNNTLIGNKDYGISLLNSHNNIIDSHTNVLNNLVGFALGSSGYPVTDNNITNNVINDSLIAIYLDSGENSLIENNQINNATGAGITVVDSLGNNNLNSILIDNSLMGVYLENATSTILQNITTENTQTSFVLEDSINCEFTNNTIYSYPTGKYNSTFSFDKYSGNLNFKGTENITSTDPKVNISKFLTITGTDWLEIKWSYEGTTPNVTDLNVNRFDGTSWKVITSIVNETTETVTANITEFSDFGLLEGQDPPVPPTPTPTRTGGGGGRNPYLSYLITVPDLDISRNITNKLRRSEFFKFKYKNEEHQLTLKEVHKEKVVIEIRSTPKEYVLELNKAKEIDLDFDGVNDVKITLLSFGLDNAEIKIERIMSYFPPPGLVEEKIEQKESEKISEPVSVKETLIPEQQEKQFETISLKEERKSLSIIWIILILILILLAFFKLLNKKQTKTKKITKEKNKKKK
jgi:parallel beta-helix repeat protein